MVIGSFHCNCKGAEVEEWKLWSMTIRGAATPGSGSNDNDIICGDSIMIGVYVYVCRY